MAVASAPKSVAVEKIHECIAAITADIVKIGVGKTRRNTQQGFDYRALDEVVIKAAPLISKHGVVIYPTVISREVAERDTKSGGTMQHVTLGVDFKLVAIADGSSVTVRTYGEAMDSGDKATNKAMSAAWKYALTMTFNIPTEGTDPDASTPEPSTIKVPKGFEDWLTDMEASADAGVKALEDAWAKSKRDYKTHVKNHHQAAWEKAKARAQKADEARAAKEAQS